MGNDLESLVKSYLESRMRAIKNPAMAELANKNADNAFTKAMNLGYTTEEWDAMCKNINDIGKSER